MRIGGAQWREGCFGRGGGGLNMGGCWRGVIGLREWVLLERESMIGERGLGKVLWGGGGRRG